MVTQTQVAPVPAVAPPSDGAVVRDDVAAIVADWALLVARRDVT